jgi:UDP-2-acetamido-2-deoxy-ribo-hexuluronate aminotransferase
MEFIDLKSQQARLRDDIDRRIAAVLDHGRYILGPEVTELEDVLSSYLGVKHTITTASGTDSLLIALMALGVGLGDEVITVPYTWISTAEVVALLGATTVFIDVEPDTWNMDATLLEAAITEKTKAIMPVGIFGQTSDMTAINEIAKRNGDIPVIEDAAQSFGATHHGVKSGALSGIGSTSFFPSKPLGGYGDGGALFTDDDELATKMRWIRVHGQEKKHYHPIVGLNGRCDTIQAAVVLSKMTIFDDEIRLRNEVADRYIERLSQCRADFTMPVLGEGNTSVYAQYTILCPDRDDIQARLSAKNIPNVAYYAVPLHLQPVFADLGYKKGDFPVTEMISDQCLSLPMSPYVPVEDQDLIAEALA